MRRRVVIKFYRHCESSQLRRACTTSIRWRTMTYDGGNVITRLSHGVASINVYMLVCRVCACTAATTLLFTLTTVWYPITSIGVNPKLIFWGANGPSGKILSGRKLAWTHISPRIFHFSHIRINVTADVTLSCCHVLRWPVCVAEKRCGSVHRSILNVLKYCLLECFL